MRFVLQIFFNSKLYFLSTVIQREATSKTISITSQHVPGVKVIVIINDILASKGFFLIGKLKTKRWCIISLGVAMIYSLKISD